VNLHLRRIPVNSQSATGTIQENWSIDFELKEVIPVITPEPDPLNPRLIRFTGGYSIGNIDWYSSGWTIFADGVVIYSKDGTSTIQYLFPESNRQSIYTVTLMVRRKNDGMTETVSQIISVDPAPIEPKIEYEILDLTEDGNVAGKKLVFDCTKSTGNNIDFSQARWTIPVAGTYNETPTQFGPTAVYNLPGAGSGLVIEVSITLSHRGGNDPLTITKVISISAGETGEPELIVKQNTEESSTGTVLILDVLSSTGPNIDWEKTEWLINSQYNRKGPVVRYDVPASGETTIVNFVLPIPVWHKPAPDSY
jgi:hypothetical protein